MGLDTLKSSVAFVAVPAGGQATLPHHLSVSGVAYQPDITTPEFASFEVISQDVTDVTVKNNGGVAADCHLLCELWHPIERQFGEPPDDGNLELHLIPRPFIPNQLVGGGASVGAGGGFTFMPANPNVGGSVFNDWNKLYAAMQAAPNILKTLYFNTSTSMSGVGAAPGLVQSGNVVTLTSSGDTPVFSTGIVQRFIDVSGSSNPANNGQFVILSAPSSTTVTYHNNQAGSATDATWVGSWTVNQIAGRGVSISGTAPNMTLTSAVPVFAPFMVGCSLSITGATSGVQNNGQYPFPITGYISPTQVTYNNGQYAGGVAEAYTGNFQVGLAAYIPAGEWDMTDVLWTGTFQDEDQFINDIAVIGDGVLLPNLVEINGSLNVYNISNTTSPIVIGSGQNGGVFNLGIGVGGHNPTRLMNFGSAAFFDTSAMALASDNYSLRIGGVLSGLTPAWNHGASPGSVGLGIVAAAGTVASNMILGTNPAGVIFYDIMSLTFLERQPGFAGTIFRGSGVTALTQASPGMNRQCMQPQSLHQLTPVIPTTAYIFDNVSGGQGLGHGTAYRLNAAAGDITQNLIPIRAENTPPNLRFNSAQGAVASESTSQTFTETSGLHAINVFGHSPIAGNGGGAAAFTVNVANNSVTFTAASGTPFATTPVNGWSKAIITFGGATSPVNNGPFVITAIGGGGASVTFTNTLGTPAVAESFPAGGTWYVGNPAAVGAGNSYAVATGVVTLTNVAGLFTPLLVGRQITTAGSSTGGNDGSFPVTSYISPTQITYANGSGASETFAAGTTWKFNDTINFGQGALAVPAGGSRTIMSDGVSNYTIISGYL